MVAGLVSGYGAPRLLSPRARLSDSQNWKTVELVLEGYAVEVMATKLGMSESGFKKRLGRLMQRAGVTTRPLLMARLYAARAARVD